MKTLGKLLHKKEANISLSHRKPTYCGIRRFKIKEIPFREDFPCYSTWKRSKHSGHLSRFRIIIGNFCIVNQK
jgi:hypothetical protein